MIDLGLASRCINITIPSTITYIPSNAFKQYTKLIQVNINQVQDSILGSPWGATSATIKWKE